MLYATMPTKRHSRLLKAGHVDDSQRDGVPSPIFVIGVQHPTLGTLALRTATTLFGNQRDHYIITYVPGDARTLDAFDRMGWNRAGTRDEGRVTRHSSTTSRACRVRP